jgi:hypothetical protein
LIFSIHEVAIFLFMDGDAEAAIAVVVVEQPPPPKRRERGTSFFRYAIFMGIVMWLAVIAFSSGILYGSVPHKQQQQLPLPSPVAATTTIIIILSPSSPPTIRTATTTSLLRCEITPGSANNAQTVVDSNAHVCHRRQLDAHTHCCLPPPSSVRCAHDWCTLLQHIVPLSEPSSHSDHQRMCCNQYEHCVSCCMHWHNDSTFATCQHACRTSSLSLDKHGAYANGQRHCYAAPSASPVHVKNTTPSGTPTVQFLDLRASP